jgi:hypothetical protein
LILLALAGAVNVLTHASLSAQAAPVRADTVHISDFSDRTMAAAFGLPAATDAHVETARNDMRCGTVEDAILCNLSVPGKSHEYCATVALVGHFIVWFDIREGQRVDERVYVAVDCDRHVITMTSLRRHPAMELTLATRDQGSLEEDRRTVVFITGR